MYLPHLLVVFPGFIFEAPLMRERERENLVVYIV
jgi:hypothetical protein